MMSPHWTLDPGGGALHEGPRAPVGKLRHVSHIVRCSEDRDMVIGLKCAPYPLLLLLDPLRLPAAVVPAMHVEATGQLRLV